MSDGAGAGAAGAGPLAASTMALAKKLADAFTEAPRCMSTGGEAPPIAPPLSVSSTADELSIIVDQDRIPDDVVAESDWVAFRVTGTLDFGLVGILARLSTALADAGISIMAVSTYDTDVVMVRAEERERAEVVLAPVGVFV